MIKIVYFIRRREGMSKEEFRDHYENSHVKLAHKYIGHLLLDYRRNYPETVSGIATGDGGAHLEAPYDVVTEMRFENQQAIDEMLRIFAEPEINAILVEDEKRFVHRPSLVTMTVDEVVDDTSLLYAK